jgi:NADH-quinone oxidoreductase subunit M
MNLILLFVFLTTNTFYKILNSFILVHGLLSALLFFLVDQVQKRYQTRNLTRLGGLAYKMTFLPIFIWFSILIFRGFPLFSKFLIEWEVLSLLYDNYSYLGIFIFFSVSIFGVLGFCRIWFTVLYGQPTKDLVTSVDMLKLDKLVALLLVVSLTLVANFLFLF